MRHSLTGFAVACLVALAVRSAGADMPVPLSATAFTEAGGTFRIEVTVRHADTGWEHFADRWDVLAPDGKVLGTRVLLHPHESEQPFTRDLDGVRVPPGIRSVVIRVHDKVHGWGTKTIEVGLPGR